jgi:hypothetical protein
MKNSTKNHLAFSLFFLIFAMPSLSEKPAPVRIIDVLIDLDGVFLFKGEEEKKFGFSSFSADDYKEADWGSSKKEKKKGKKDKEKKERKEASVETPKEPEAPEDLIIKAAGKKYRVNPDAVALIESFQKPPAPGVEYRLSFFSARNALRNKEALDAIKLTDGKTSAREAVNGRVFSRAHMRRLRSGEVKDVTLVLPDANINDTIFLDDQLHYTAPGQEKAHLWVNLEDTNQRLLHARGIAEKAVRSALDKKKTIAEALTDIQYESKKDGTLSYREELQSDPEIFNLGTTAFKAANDNYKPSPKEIKDKEHKEPNKRLKMFLEDKKKADEVNKQPAFDKEEFRDLRDLANNVILKKLPAKDHVFLLAGQELAPLLPLLKEMGVEARAFPVSNYQFSLAEKNQGPRHAAQLAKFFQTYYPKEEELKGKKVALITVDEKDPIALLDDVQNFLRALERPRNLVQGILTTRSFTPTSWDKLQAKGRLEPLKGDGYETIVRKLERGDFKFLAPHPRFDPSSDFVEDIAVSETMIKELQTEVAKLNKDASIEPISHEERTKPKPIPKYVYDERPSWFGSGDPELGGYGGYSSHGSYQSGWDSVFGKKKETFREPLDEEPESKVKKKSSDGEKWTDKDAKSLKTFMEVSGLERAWRIHRTPELEAADPTDPWTKRDTAIFEAFLRSSSSLREVLDALYGPFHSGVNPQYFKDLDQLRMANPSKRLEILTRIHAALVREKKNPKSENVKTAQETKPPKPSAKPMKAVPTETTPSRAENKKSSLLSKADERKLTELLAKGTTNVTAWISMRNTNKKEWTFRDSILAQEIYEQRNDVTALYHAAQLIVSGKISSLQEDHSSELSEIRSRIKGGEMFATALKDVVSRCKTSLEKVAEPNRPSDASKDDPQP